ncbi:hypothetical protein PAXRUDRAFT_19467 [Paxillus rubicundulus Ve08.2h10]|uniref:Uncharacterized protein n=1 Tax=Paxillus rubicundulus Ve08.2h10 TaxID=930991 RepID=A0A0D0BTU9_9AGAM|nr:hypothetical protein PAXRUDRAFT_19467 [Paxillus rubicundulus Ve08.2h10]
MEAKTYHTKELELLTSHSEHIDQQLQCIQDSLHVINVNDDGSTEALGIVQNAIKGSQETFKGSFTAWSDSLCTSSQTLCKELYSANQSNFVTVEDTLKAMWSLINTIVDKGLAFIKAEGESALQAKALINEIS